jgi:single-strand DNA-binding protein
MFHTVIIVGNVGRDPEMRYTPSGQAVTSFSVATSRTYTNSQGTAVKETVWFRITTWGKTAEACSQYLHKGNKVFIEGRLQPDLQSGAPRVFQRKDGTWSASYEISASTVRFLSSRTEATASGEEAPEAAGEEVVDDIPF